MTIGNSQSRGSEERCAVEFTDVRCSWGPHPCCRAKSISGPFGGAALLTLVRTRRSGVEDWGADYQTFSDSDLRVVPSDDEAELRQLGRRD